MNKTMAAIICTFVPAILITAFNSWIFEDNPFETVMSLSAILGLFLLLFQAWTKEDYE